MAALTGGKVADW